VGPKSGFMKYYDTLFRTVEKHVPLSDSDKENLKKYFIPLNVPKRTIIKDENIPSEYFYFVNKGSLRAYIYGKYYVTHIVMFALDGGWCGDIKALVDQPDHNLVIQTIESSELLALEINKFNQMMEEVPAMEKFFRIVLTRLLVVSQERTTNMLNLDATKRYLAFRERFVEIEKRIPQHMIASYLGITPEFLSIIRSKLAKGATLLSADTEEAQNS
jgi:CRP-like cAMP-binding protein